jgi:hypothetical protein
MARAESSICGVCGTESEGLHACPACGSDVLFGVVDRAVLMFPPETIPCARCNSAECPVAFRGWAQLMAFVFWARESRLSAYLCSECARRQTIKSLLFTAFLGWWSFPSWFFYGWRATYINWRAVFAAPRRPLEWGAISAVEFAEMLEQMHDEAEAEIEEEWLLTETPLRHLSPIQIDLVVGAEGLYEHLGVPRDASLEQLRRAYRQRCKEIHPDLHEGSRTATEEMLRLNQAWEILRSPAMREAYDWLQSQRDEAVA